MQPIYLLVITAISGSAVPTHVMVTEAQWKAVVQSYKRPADAPGLPRIGEHCYAPDGRIVDGTGM
jgi:hypothetical protein